MLRNLLKSGYRGRIVPVNPKGGELLGLPVVPTLSQVSAACELAVVVVRPDLILDVAREAAASGHRNLLVLPGGFAEGGEEGQARDRALRELAQAQGLTIAGPNCAGLIDLLDRANPCASTFFRDMPRGGGVALISQSGAIAEEVIGSSHSLGIPVGAIVSVGNAMQLGLTEYVEHLGADPECRAILLYVESFGDAQRFRALARDVTARKPIVALLGGRTAPGREAALRHTGSRAMTEAEADAFCADSGMVRVKSLRALMLAGKAFGAHPGGIGRRVLLLSNSGGPGVLAADRCAELGLEMPELPAALAERLRTLYPAEAVVANPLDLLADAREDRFGDTLQAVLQLAREQLRRHPHDPCRSFHGRCRPRRCPAGGARHRCAAADPAFDDGHAGRQAGVDGDDGGGGCADVRQRRGHGGGRCDAGALSRCLERRRKHQRQLNGRETVVHGSDGFGAAWPKVDEPTPAL